MIAKDTEAETIRLVHAQWSEVFPHAACVVTLVDRLIHRAGVIEVEAESFRLKEAKDLGAARSRAPNGWK